MPGRQICFEGSFTIYVEKGRMGEISKCLPKKMNFNRITDKRGGRGEMTKNFVYTECECPLNDKMDAICLALR